MHVEQQAAAIQQILIAMGKLSEVSAQTVKAVNQVRNELKKLNAVSIEIQEAV